MFTRLMIISIALAFLPVLCLAGLDFGTGDLEFDAALENLNISAKLDLETFRAELRIEYGVSDSQWDRMTATLEMEPAEVYLTAELSRIADKSVEEVAEVWLNERSRGWGRIARSLGIPPGSKGFKALKDGTSEKTNRGRGH